MSFQLLEKAEQSKHAKNENDCTVQIEKDRWMNMWPRSEEGNECQPEPG